MIDKFYKADQIMGEDIDMEGVDVRIEYRDQSMNIHYPNGVMAGDGVLMRIRDNIPGYVMAVNGSREDRHAYAERTGL